MEDFRIDLVIGQGPGARIHPYQLSQFTLVGATTRAGLLMAPLRSRFGIVHRLDFYTPEDLFQIVTGPRGFSESRLTTPAPKKLRAAAAVLRAWRTACSVASAISPRFARTAT